MNEWTYLPAVSQAKAAEVEAVKQQVTEMQKEREELNNTISKLKQVWEQNVFFCSALSVS